MHKNSASRSPAVVTMEAHEWQVTTFVFIQTQFAADLTQFLLHNVCSAFSKELLQVPFKMHMFQNYR